MSLLDNGFINFNGDSVTGRVPAQVIVAGGVALTKEQQGALAHAYKLFCDAHRVSLANYLVQHRRLDDGTLLRMEHNGNQGDRVFVTPPPIDKPMLLQGLFMGVPASLGVLDSGTAPKYSKQARFRGATAPPVSLRASRKLDDSRAIDAHPGNLTWWSNAIKVNRRPLVVSWYGKATRYGRADYYGAGKQWASSAQQDFLYGKTGSDARAHWDDAFRANVWTNGIRHATRKVVVVESDDTFVAVPVVSAALKKDEDGLWLWVVSFESAQLCVFKGLIDPYSNGAVTLAKEFDIDFQVVSTGLTIGNPLWEGMIQPFYFNASCTKCASLLAVRQDSPTNTTAGGMVAGLFTGTLYDGGTSQFVALVAEVDLVAQTTAFDPSHVDDPTLEVTGDTDGDAVDFLGLTEDTLDPGYSGTFTGGGTNTYDVTWTRQHYGGVDYVGDQLTVAIVENVTVFSFVDEGAYTYAIVDNDGEDNARSGSLHRQIDKAVTGSYRVFQHHDDAELAAAAYAKLPIDTLYAESSEASGDTGNGWHLLSVSDDVLVHATLAGGDLRHQAVVVSELLEVGTTVLDETFTHNFDGDTAENWTPGAYWPHSGTPAANHEIVRSYDTHTVGRQPARRLLVFKDATLVNAGAYRRVYANDLSTAPLFSQLQSAGTTDTYLPSFVGDPGTFFWTPVALGSVPLSPDRATADQLHEFGWEYGGFGGGSDRLVYWFYPHYQGGSPYVNTSAFAHDADTSQWFYNVADYHYSGSYPGSFAITAGFVIAGTDHTPDLTAYYDGAPANTAIASPIYLDNVPSP